MSQPVEDTPSQRFQSFWLGLFGMLGFAVLAWLIVSLASPEEGAADEMVLKAADGRREVLAPLKAEQHALMTTVEVVDADAGLVRIPVADAMRLVIPELKATEAAPSEALVPGSPTQLKQMQQGSQPEAAPAAETEGEEAAAESGDAGQQ